MVFGRKGTGGPQLAEVARMLGQERQAVERERAWLARQAKHLASADALRENAFMALANAAGDR